MAIHKSIKPMAQLLLLLLAIHVHIQTVGSTPETSASLANLKHSSVTGNKPSSEIDVSVWRRELGTGGGGGGGGRGGGGGSSGGGGGSSGGRGGSSGSRGGGGGGGSGTGDSSSGDYLKHYGLSNSLIFIGFVGFLVVVC